MWWYGNYLYERTSDLIEWLLNTMINNIHHRMPECTVCGETNFERVEGFFYCVSCQTQSQVNRSLVHWLQLWRLCSQHAREEEVEVDWRNENEDEEAPVERPAMATVQKMKKGISNWTLLALTCIFICSFQGSRSSMGLSRSLAVCDQSTGQGTH